MASLLVLIAGAASAQVAVFDTSTNLLTIPSVKVGAETYTNVILKNSFVFTLQDATEQSPAGKGYAIYDTQTMVLTIPAVKLGTATYLDVKLLNTGNFVFILQSTTQLTASTVGEVNAFFASLDAITAKSLPAIGATMFSLDDACYRNDGRTKAYNIADYDPNSAWTNANYAHGIGQRRTNLQVSAVRNSVNSNGSSRREIDVQYDAVYTDGSTQKVATETLISGSSQGTSGCSSPQTGSSRRRLGDQRLVNFSLNARMTREERYSIATGEALTPSVRYRRDMRFAVTDPLGNATYVVVSGPGPTSYDAKSAGWSWKMVSPRVMRSAPELAGKTGNFTNALGAGGGSTVSYQTLGFTGGEKSNGTPILVGDISIAIPSGTSNSNVAEAVMVGLRGSPSFTDHAIERRENTLLVIFPPTVTDVSALSFSAGGNTGINMSVNAPSGVINGINYGTNPWLSFINNSTLSSFQTLGFTGYENSNGGAVIIGGVSMNIPSGLSGNAALAQTVGTALSASTRFVNHIIVRRDNTLMVIFPPSITNPSDVSFSNTSNNRVGMTVNGPSGIIYGVNFGTNPWSIFFKMPDDTFYYCGAAVNSFPVASASDCLTYGAIGDTWGIGSISTPNAAADKQFTDQGWVAGGAYRIDVYNDDGWKTVNGHASRTPIATYYETLKALPRTFVEMAGTGATPTSNDQFARFNVGTAAAFYNALMLKQATINLSWSTQPSLSSTEPLRLHWGGDYFEGPKLGLASGANWPKLSSITYTYPGSTATSQASWPAERQLVTDMNSVSFYNVILQYSDRNQSRVRSVLAFQ